VLALLILLTKGPTCGMDLSVRQDSVISSEHKLEEATAIELVGIYLCFYWFSLLRA